MFEFSRHIKHAKIVCLKQGLLLTEADDIFYSLESHFGLVRESILRKTSFLVFLSNFFGEQLLVSLLKIYS